MPRFKKIAANLLIALGVLALAKRSFPAPQKTHRADLGPVEIKVRESRRIEVPVWVGVVLVAVGTGFLLIEKK